MSALEDYDKRLNRTPLEPDIVFENVMAAERHLERADKNYAVETERTICWLHDRLQAVYAALENPKAPVAARCAWCFRAAGGTDEAWRALPVMNIEDSAAHAQVCEHNPLVRALADERAAYAALKPELDRREDEVSKLCARNAGLEAELEELRGRKIGKGDAWAEAADESTGMYHHMKGLHDAMKKAIRALLDTETPAGELRRAIAELVR